MKDRHAAIIGLLDQYEQISVSEIAAQLDVSEVTVRKDLMKLEADGLLRRTHGYAERISPDDINGRLAFRYEVKRRIAQRAAELVFPGETVMIESGSTCALLAAELASSGKDVTIITNSVFIAGYIRHLPGAKLVLLGGDFQNDAAVSCGPLTKQCAGEFHVKRLFVGTDGFDRESGFTQVNHMRADTVRAMRACADELVILTDSTKFRSRGLVSQFSPDEVDVVVTDKDIEADVSSYLSSRGVKVLAV